MTNALGDYEIDAKTAINGLHKAGVTSVNTVLAIAEGTEEHESPNAAKLRRVMMNAVRINKSRDDTLAAIRELCGDRFTEGAAVQVTEATEDNSTEIAEQATQMKLLGVAGAVSKFTGNPENRDAVLSLLRSAAGKKWTPDQQKLYAEMFAALAEGVDPKDIEAEITRQFELNN